MLNWACFPRSAKPTPMALQVVEIFKAAHPNFDSSYKTLQSNSVLAHVETGLQGLGFRVEIGN